MIKKRIVCLLAVCICLFELIPSFALAQEEKRIRVGFPEQPGLTERDQNGELGGYTYEYLMEIAQYTGWEYEFVSVPGDLNESLTKMLEMLETGELDLLGALVKNEQTELKFDFPGYNYGTGYSELSVLDSNTQINESNFYSIKGLRIGALKTATKRIEELKKFCAVNHMEPEIYTFEHQDEILQAMKSGEIDAALCSDMGRWKGTHPVAKFSPAPFYFATTKGNHEIINKLDLGIMKINESDPHFAAALYQKYFNVYGNEVILSEEEKAFIQEAGTLKVAVAPDQGPYQYFDEQTGAFRGIAKEVFDRITEKTGLTFEFLQASSMEELREWTATAKVDAVAGIPYHYTMVNTYHLVLTRPYVSSQRVMFVNRSLNAEQLTDQKIAVSKEAWEDSLVQGEQIAYYDTLEQCLRAVDKGIAGYGYGDSYSVEFLSDSPYFKNISLVPQTGNEQRTCIGVVKPADMQLLSILNKVLSNLSERDIQTIIFQGTAQLGNGTTFAAWIDTNPRTFMALVLCIVLLIMGLLIGMLCSKLNSSRKLALANERYLKLSDMAKEFLFEYNYRKDKLTLSESCAQKFQCAVEREHYIQSLKKAPLTQNLEQIFQLFENRSKMKNITKEFLLPVPNEGNRWFQVVCAILYEGTEPAYAIGKLIDIQTEKEERGLLLEKSQKDGLTDIYNTATSRELISEYLNQKPAQEKGALMIIDVDFFKEVNDLLGHYIGDEVLTGIADTLKRSFRQTDIIGRLGGDEFVVYLKNVPNASFIEEKCQTLCDNVKKTVEHNGKRHDLTISIGAAEVCGRQTFDEIYQRADKALYQVKKRGRNGYELN